MTQRRDAAIEVTVSETEVAIVIGGQSMTMSKITARKLVAALLERLG